MKANGCMKKDWSQMLPHNNTSTPSIVLGHTFGTFSPIHLLSQCLLSYICLHNIYNIVSPMNIMMISKNIMKYPLTFPSILVHVVEHYL